MWGWGLAQLADPHTLLHFICTKGACSTDVGGGREGVCYIFTNWTNLRGSLSCLPEEPGLLPVRLRGFSTSAEISARSHSPRPRSPLPCRIFLFLLSSFDC